MGFGLGLENTGWQSISEIKYCFTVTSFWVLVTFWAYRRLTRCGPFDKISFWSLLMHFWNNQSVVPKEAFSWWCINFSDFFDFLEKFFDYSSQKKIREWFMNLFLVLLIGSLEGKIPIILKIHSVIQFFGNYDQKLFFKNCKNH